MPIENFTLENGLRVLIIDTNAFPTATALLLVGAGSRYETEANNGIAHFFEHMVFKGSKKYPDSLTLTSTIENFGGIFNAYTSKDHTGYWIKGSTKHLNTSLSVLADMVQHPLLKTEEIEREKGVIIEEINMYEDQPEDKVENLYEEMLYVNNPLGYKITGSKNSVSKFSKQTFQQYLNDLYNPENAVLVVSGGLGKIQNTNLKKQIQELFGNWQKRKAISSPVYKEKQSHMQVKVFNKKTEQAHFFFGWRGFSFLDDRRFIQTVLSIILGGGFGSRLFHEVRERRGLCYYIGTQSQMYSDTGSLYTRAGVGTDLTKIKQALQIIYTEHQKLTEKLVTDVEFQRAKEIIRGHLLMSLEDSKAVASYFGTDWLLKRSYLEPEKLFAKIDSVTKEQVRTLASELFKKDKANIALVGPFTQTEIESCLQF